MQELTVEASGMTFDALAWGPEGGPLLLALHGFPQTADAWRAAAPAWAAAGLRVVAPNLRGVSPGARPKRRDAYRIEALVADVLGLADACGAARFHLIGHDWGGALAWHVAGRHAERLETLTVCSVPHPAAFRRALEDPACDQRQRSAYFETFRTEGAGEDLWLGEGREGLARMYGLAGLGAEEAAPYVATFSQRETLTAFLEWYRAADPASPEGMAPITTPTLYVWSTHDPALGREAAEWTGEHVEALYRFEVCEGVDHWIPEHATEALVAWVLEHVG